MKLAFTILIALAVVGGVVYMAIDFIRDVRKARITRSSRASDKSESDPSLLNRQKPGDEQ